MIKEIIFTGATTAGLLRAHIVLQTGAHVYVWYEPDTYKLRRANNAPRDPAKSYDNRAFQRRRLDHEWGRRLQAAFTPYAHKHEPAQLAEHRAAAERAERARLASIAAEQAAHVRTVAELIVRKLDADPIFAIKVVELLIAEGYVAREGRAT